MQKFKDIKIKKKVKFEVINIPEFTIAPIIYYKSLQYKLFESKISTTKLL